MKKIALALAILFLAAVPAQALGSNTVFWQDYGDQKIKGKKWVTLNYHGNQAIKKEGKGRTLYCVKMHIRYTKKPAYIKLRLARVLPNGSLDTTGTNTWVLGPETPTKWQGSLCWIIDTDYPVEAQVKIGGKGSYTSYMRQFKAWSPETEFPADMVSDAPLFNPADG